MQLIIHRGTKEIGGSCVEIKTAKTRMLIDFGMPLVTPDRQPFDSKELRGKSIADLKKSKILLNIPGLYQGEKKSIDAVLISHSHPDHYGLLNYIHPEIPVYLSEGTKELIAISNLFTLMRVGAINARLIKPGKAFIIGDIKIMPMLVDHSAFDALAFLIEADRKRVFYSGDFRGHGRKGVLLKAILKNPPKNIDCLLMEGTRIGKGESSYQYELSVQKRIEDIVKTSDNITFLFTSSQNIDRIVSAYKACLKTGATFVIDIYTAYVLDRLQVVSKGIPQFNWRNIRVKFYKNQADILAGKVSKELLYKYNKQKIEMPEINSNKKKILMLSRYNSIFPRILRSIPEHNGAKIIFSMWEGYLNEEFKEFCKREGLLIESVHASGHASFEVLKAFAGALQPKMLIPIHTFSGKDYLVLFRNTKVLDDGESLYLN